MDGTQTSIEIGGEEIADAMSFHEGVPHLQYETVRWWIEANIPPEESREAWASVERAWLALVGQALGGMTSYQIFQSENVLLLARMNRKLGQYAVGRVERAIGIVEELLPGVSQRAVPGKHMVLFLASDHDVERYVAGMQCGTEWSGMCINRGLVHVLVQSRDEIPESTVAHEMTHACLHHLDVPRWLNEAIAQRVERIIRRATYPEPSAQWLAKWRSMDLPEFWSGEAFNKDAATKTTAYVLADCLLHEICKSGPTTLGQFILNARSDDGGHASADEHLGHGLEFYVDKLLNPPPPPPSPAAKFFRKLFRGT